jgi:hypothetical protein
MSVNILSSKKSSDECKSGFAVDLLVSQLLHTILHPQTGTRTRRQRECRQRQQASVRCECTDVTGHRCISSMAVTCESAFTLVSIREANISADAVIHRE